MSKGNFPKGYFIVLDIYRYKKIKKLTVVCKYIFMENPVLSTRLTKSCVAKSSVYEILGLNALGNKN